MRKRHEPFRLPMMLTNLHAEYADGRHLFHSLDFDIVAVAKSEEEAWRKLVLSVRTYVEYGLSNKWHDQIVFPAPQEFWDRITPDTPTKVRESITIAGEEKKVIEVHELAGAAA